MELFDSSVGDQTDRGDQGEQRTPCEDHTERAHHLPCIPHHPLCW